MAVAMGAMMQSAELGMIILVDGFIMTSVILAASPVLIPHILDFAIFGHQGDESGHKRMLDAMGVNASCTSTSVSEGSGQYAPIRS